MTLGRSPSQRIGVTKGAWYLRPRSGFADVETDSNLLLQLLSVIDAFVIELPKMEARIDALKAQGLNTDFLEKKLKVWAAQAQRGLDFFTSLIEKTPSIQSTIDNLAGGQTTPGLKEVRVGAWKEFVSELKPAKPNTGLADVSNWITYTAAGGAALLGAVYLAPALLSAATWAGVAAVLRVVIPLASSVAPWFFGAQIVNSVKETVQGSDAAHESLQKCLTAIESASTVEEKTRIQKLCSDAQPSSLPFWMAIGGAVGVGALLYLQSKTHETSVQSRSAVLSGMPRKHRRRI